MRERRAARTLAFDLDDFFLFFEAFADSSIISSDASPSSDSSELESLPLPSSLPKSSSSSSDSSSSGCGLWWW